MAYSARNKIAGIYMLSFPNGSYIGSSKEIQKRFVAHRNHFKNGTHENEFLQKAYNEDGPPEYRIVIICGYENLIFYEQMLMDFYKPEYNISRIAGRIEHNEKTRLKMSRVLMGRVHSQETKDKIRETLKGRRPPDSLYEAQKVAAERRRSLKPPKPPKVAKCSPEFREKIRQIAIEKFKDPEKRANISRVMREKYKDPEFKSRAIAARKAATERKKMVASAAEQVCQP